MTGKKWTETDMQVIVDGLLRGQSKRTIAAGLGRKESGAEYQVLSDEQTAQEREA